jgi:hypothetical protein
VYVSVSVYVFLSVGLCAQVQVSPSV